MVRSIMNFILNLCILVSMVILMCSIFLVLVILLP